jgi:hypothetical protein
MSTMSLLNVIKKLPPAQFNRVLNGMLVLKSQNRSRTSSNRERVLLANIVRGAPAPLLQEYRTLVEKRREGGLSVAEQERIVAVADELEAFNVRWMRWLTELAGLRGATVPRLMSSLELPVRPYV